MVAPLERNHTFQKKKNLIKRLASTDAADVKPDSKLKALYQEHRKVHSRYLQRQELSGRFKELMKLRKIQLVFIEN